MKYAILFVIFLTGCASNPNNSVSASGTRIYSTDSMGNIQYHKTSYIIIKNTIYEVDKFGTILYHKPQKKIVEK